MGNPIPSSRDSLLFTPGPLTTSRAVKEAMLRDLGSRDTEFVAVVARVRERLLRVAGVSREQGYEAVLLQGSGTFGVEAMLGTAVPRDGRLLVLANGAYGERMIEIASRLGIPHEAVRVPEDEPIDPAALPLPMKRATHVAVVHCETTSGILNPAAEIGRRAREMGRTFLVDAMSSFGALPLDLAKSGVDFLAASSNKCLEGVPGIALVIARREALLESRGRARSLSLDVAAQWLGLEESGQFRYTPPTHVVLALDRALEELELEGGVEARGARYARNHAILVAGMRSLGFREFLRQEVQSPIITSFHYPEHPAFRFEDFYERLRREGMVIYPGKVGRANCFRIGNIGRLFEPDIRGLLAVIPRVLAEMGLPGH
jgi:2-aminoethylphosphonate-pyruvate transaminase